MAAKDNALIGAWFEGQKYFPEIKGWGLCSADEVPVLRQSALWLERYFKGERPSVEELSLAPLGGEFRQMVWRELLNIPYGETVTYGEISKAVAAQMGKATMSAQAIGGAVGHNPISIIVPCHRVVESDGKLTGYAGGVEKKLRLLRHEANLHETK